MQPFGILSTALGASRGDSGEDREPRRLHPCTATSCLAPARTCGICCTRFNVFADSFCGGRVCRLTDENPGSREQCGSSEAFITPAIRPSVLAAQRIAHARKSPRIAVICEAEDNSRRGRIRSPSGTSSASSSNPVAEFADMWLDDAKPDFQPLPSSNEAPVILAPKRYQVCLPIARSTPQSLRSSTPQPSSREPHVR